MDVKLSDDARRLVCRFAFLLVCLLLTLLTARWALFPRSTAQWAALISQQLGVPVQLDRVSTRTPQRTEFFGLSITPSDCSSAVTVDHIVVQNHADGRSITVGNVTGPVRTIRESLTRINSSIEGFRFNGRPLRVGINRLIIRNDGSSSASELNACQLSGLSIHLDSTGDRWQLRFHREGTANDLAPCSLIRTALRDQTIWQIDSGDQQLPAWVVSTFFPAMSFLDGRCQLSGKATLFRKPTGWSGQLSDLRLTDIDLGQLVSRRFGCRLEGTASIHIHSAMIADDQIFRLHGELSSPGGVAGAGLLHACQECAAMQIVSPWGTEDVAFSRLQFGFRLNQFEIAVFAPKTSDAILVSESGSKVLIPRDGCRLPQENLMALLTWPHHRAIRVNHKTAALATVLAWPPLPHEYARRFVVDPPATEARPQVGERIIR